MKTVCGLSRVTVKLTMERDVAVKFTKCHFFHAVTQAKFHYLHCIGEISETDIELRIESNHLNGQIPLERTFSFSWTYLFIFGNSSEATL